MRNHAFSFFRLNGEKLNVKCEKYKRFLSTRYYCVRNTLRNITESHTLTLTYIRIQSNKQQQMKQKHRRAKGLNDKIIVRKWAVSHKSPIFTNISI